MRGGGELSEVFPPSPVVPANFTEPAPAYKRHAWLAMVALLGFVAVYLGLTGYLGWTVFKLWRGATIGSNPVGAFMASVPALLLLSFLVRGLFAIKSVKDKSLVELKREEQPLLFGFLDRLADETKAPRPRRVYLSARVNAAVFYELSFWNLIFPTTKNLELGLGLVNALSLDELKAVIAHEYGHFAQRTMAVGRWTYVAQQIAGNIIASRGYIDRFLAGLSVSDIRIAWLGWALRIVVWSVRAVLDTAFRIALIASRALSREMEFQADRVAASVTGSDSLVHALHRLGAADEAWQEAANFAVDETRVGRPVKDLFALQSLSLASIREVLGEPDYGRTPAKGSGAGHRVFDESLAQPPRMWLTHPPNREREDSVKATYVPSPLDERSAWELFANAQSLREQVTATLLAEVKPLPKPIEAEGTHEERLEKRYRRASMNPAYRGVYLGRSIAGWAKDWNHLIGNAPADVTHALNGLYPESLRHTLAQLRERRGEEDQLEGLQDGVLTAPGGSIRYRGRELRRKELPDVLEGVKKDREQLEDAVRAHDRAVRGAHLAAARSLGRGWPEHLEGLVALLHVATQTQRSINDEHFYLQHVLDIAFVDGRVSSGERSQILTAARQVHDALVNAWRVYADVNLPSDVQKLFDADGGWECMKQKLGLPAPNEQHLGEWINAENGWARGASADFGALVSATLNTLLDVEAKIAAWAKEGSAPDEAPAPARVPSKYQRCIEGEERKRQKKLGWWDRFQTADGIVPGTLRAAVATAVLLPVLTVTGNCGSTTLHVVNGLDATVNVEVAGKHMRVAPHTTDYVKLDEAGTTHVRTMANGQLVEEFDADVGGAFVDQVYDVASATPLVTWKQVYGNQPPIPDETIYATRWFIAHQNDVLKEPPRTVSDKASKIRTVLTAVFDHLELVRAISDPAEKEAMLLGHLRFDDVRSDTYGRWLNYAETPAAKEVITARADRETSVAIERYLQDSATPEEHTARCEKNRQRAAKAPDDADLIYLATRCDEGADFITPYEAHRDNGWLANAAAASYAERHEWAKALEASQTAFTAKSTCALHGKIAMEALRISRASRDDWRQAGPPQWLLNDPLITMVRNVYGTRKPDEDTDVTIYRALLEGQLDAALSAAQQLRRGELRDLVSILVALSDGADPKQKALVRPFTPATAPMPAHPFLAALAAREGGSVDEWSVAAQSPPEDAELVAFALDRPRLLANTRDFTAEVSKRSPSSECHLLTLGTISLGDDAPTAWKARVKRVCFPWEHPFFR